jgi:mannose-6-phosphate isomerase-like protein (cupin superfamily)
VKSPPAFSPAKALSDSGFPNQPASYTMKKQQNKTKGTIGDAAKFPYVTLLDVRYQHLEVIDEKALADACPHKWYNQTLCEVNDSVVRLGVVQGEYHWHKHDDDDEFFYVVEGRLSIDLKDRTIELGPRQGVVVSKGVLHRPRTPLRTVILMVETKEIVPTGDLHSEIEERSR